MTKPSIKQVVEAAGISRGYACDVLNEQQAPSRPLAVLIYRRFGWKHPSIVGLTDEQIRASEILEPWTPPKDRAA